MTMRSIDLNADVGEGFDDEAILAHVTSANVACGFHAGDAETMRTVCRIAAARGVQVGAQVSYRDRANFGRRALDVSYDVVRTDVEEQLDALRMIATSVSTRVRYVKPHGALYHACSSNPEHGRAVLDAMRAHDSSLLLLAAAGSAFAHHAGAQGFTVVPEAFADRRYRDATTLVSRDEPDALLAEPADAAAQAVALVMTGRVLTATGGEVSVSARSICVHGDSPHAAAIAAAVRSGLMASGVAVKAFG
jgi:5-oxoprolinase (ATP-hydrolysing) subunit A